MRFTLDGSPEEISAFLKRASFDEVPTTDHGDDAGEDDAASMVFETPPESGDNVERAKP